MPSIFILLFLFSKLLSAQTYCSNGEGYPVACISPENPSSESELPLQENKFKNDWFISFGTNWDVDKAKNDEGHDVSKKNNKTDLENDKRGSFYVKLGGNFDNYKLFEVTEKQPKKPHHEVVEIATPFQAIPVNSSINPITFHVYDTSGVTMKPWESSTVRFPQHSSPTFDIPAMRAINSPLPSIGAVKPLLPSLAAKRSPLPPIEAIKPILTSSIAANVTPPFIGVNNPPVHLSMPLPNIVKFERKTQPTYHPRTIDSLLQFFSQLGHRCYIVKTPKGTFTLIVPKKSSFRRPEQTYASVIDSVSASATDSGSASNTDFPSVPYFGRDRSKVTNTHFSGQHITKVKKNSNLIYVSPVQRTMGDVVSSIFKRPEMTPRPTLENTDYSDDDCVFIEVNFDLSEYLNTDQVVFSPPNSFNAKFAQFSNSPATSTSHTSSFRSTSTQSSRTNLTYLFAAQDPSRNFFSIPPALKGLISMEAKSQEGNQLSHQFSQADGLTRIKVLERRIPEGSSQTLSLYYRN